MGFPVLLLLLLLVVVVVVSGLVLLCMIWCSAVKKSFNSLALISFIFLSRDCNDPGAVPREKNEGDQGEGVERLLNRRAPDHTQEHQARHCASKEDKRNSAGDRQDQAQQQDNRH